MLQVPTRLCAVRARGTARTRCNCVAATAHRVRLYRDSREEKAEISRKATASEKADARAALVLGC